MVLDVRVGGGLVEDTVMSGLGGVGRYGWWRFGGGLVEDTVMSGLGGVRR